MNNNVTEWLVNLSWQQMLVIVVSLLVLRFVLLKHKSKTTKLLANIAETLAMAGGLIFLIIFPFLIQPFFIPSESMVPTFLENDRIFVNKAVYRMRQPRRGDIIVFNAPPAAVKMSTPEGIPVPAETRFIKRVIAVPGDTVRVVPGYVDLDGMRLDHSELRRLLGGGLPESLVRVRLRNGGLYLNDKWLTESEVASRLQTRGNVQIKPGYVVLNGIPLNEPYIEEDPEMPYPDRDDPRVWDSLNQAVVQNRVKLVGAGDELSVKLGGGQFLVMGDNRNHSLDGRFWGPLDSKRILGRAMFVWYPLNRLHWAR